MGRVEIRITGLSPNSFFSIFTKVVKPYFFEKVGNNGVWRQPHYTLGSNNGGDLWSSLLFRLRMA